jgi:hypothetical protein
LLAIGGLKAWQRAQVGYNANWLQTTGLETPEYRPTTAPKELFTKKALLNLASQVPNVDLIDKGSQGTAKLIDWQPRLIKIAVDLNAQANISVAQFYYSSWRSQVIETSAVLPVTSNPQNGLISVTAPPGRYHLEIRLTAGRYERWGQRISLLSGLIVACLIFQSAFTKHSNE